MNDLGTLLRPLAQPTSKDVFYVIGWEGTFSGDKYVFDNAAGYVTGDDWHSPKAARFASPGAAVYALSVFEKANGRELFGSAVVVVRVEAITTPGKSTRVEVPLGDKRQTGVAILAWKTAGGLSYSGNPSTGSRWVTLDRAKVYATLSEAAYALQAAAVSQGYAIAGSPFFIGVTDETTPSTTTYTETVLA